jgi:molybdate transport system permease protein
MDGKLNLRNAFLVLMAALFVAFVTGPLVCMVLGVPLGHLGQYLRDPMVVDSLALTLKTTAISVPIVIVLGSPLAYLLARREFAGKQVLDALVDLPMSMPPVVMGFALLMTFAPRGPIGSLLKGMGIEIVFTTTAVIIAQVMMAAPLYVKAARTGFENVDDSLLRASLVLGASRWRTFFRVTLPLAAGGVITGAILAWARAAGEFCATITFAGNMPKTTQTAPVAVFMGVNRDLSVGVTLATILLAFSFAVLLGARILLKRSPR